MGGESIEQSLSMEARILRVLEAHMEGIAASNGRVA